MGVEDDSVELLLLDGFEGDDSLVLFEDLGLELLGVGYAQED